MRHVALMGKAQSGKDTVAGILVRHAAYTRLAFADRLKESALRVDPVVFCGEFIGRDIPERDNGVEGYRLASIVEAFGWEEAKSFPEVRRFLQEYGQTIREMDPKFWIRPVVDQMAQGRRLNMPCVVTDVRYRNEVLAMRREGALVVRVVRPGAGLGGDAGKHSSETELDGVEPDVVLDNSGTLADLTVNVGRLFEQYLNGE